MFVKDGVYCQPKVETLMQINFQPKVEVVVQTQGSKSNLKWCAGFYVTRLGKALFSENFKWNVRYDVVWQTGLLEFYAKHGFVKDVQSLFHSMREKNSVTWNSMITCYSKIGDVKSAQLLFDHNPIKDVVSWNAMMHGYC
ncbi:Pentatricopeptide repeat-containing protein [Artemisia annua]|uniref:Pentatricopeptide repeat-containing protein n=1 Tax=Artemisia annua TaxID=35608 RepID=A0A2U1L2K7_ARTAN|nr:Pentatricopeptide repeat-containing protein [Artemisia annua]